MTFPETYQINKLNNYADKGGLSGETNMYTF